MKVRFEIEVNVSTAGLARYYRQYPGFQQDVPPENAADTLIREAIAAWDSEALLASGEPRVISQAVLFPPGRPNADKLEVHMSEDSI